MRFRDVQLVNRGKYTHEKLEQNLALSYYWENVRNLFCIHLESDLEILGISKLNIKLGNFDGEVYEPPAKDGIAIYKRDDFSYQNFSELSEGQKDEKSLFYIQDSLAKICANHKVPKTVIDAVDASAQKVRDNNFEHERNYKKTTKWNKKKSIHAITLLHYKKGGIDATVLFKDKQGNTLKSNKVLANEPWENIWHCLWQCEWTDTLFVIKNKTGDTLSTVEYRNE